MTDIFGDETKKSEECKKDWTKCKHIKMTYSDFDKESYDCAVCGESFNLYYEDMQ